MSVDRDESGFWCAVVVACIVMAGLMTGCGRSQADQDRDRFAAQVAADIDANAQAAQQGGDAEASLESIRRLCAALAGAFGYRIDPAAKPVYPSEPSP